MTPCIGHNKSAPPLPVVEKKKVNFTHFSGVQRKKTNSTVHDWMAAHSCCWLTVPGTCVEGINVQLTIATPVLAQAVIATEQVQCRVQVCVNLVYSVADGFQPHPPVWSLRFMFVRGQTPRKVEDQGENSNKTVVLRSPLHVPEGSRSPEAHLFLLLVF